MASKAGWNGSPGLSTLSEVCQQRGMYTKQEKQEYFNYFYMFTPNTIIIYDVK